ncbi:efflux RND transporter periplasmic adaptor subunit [Myroides pelagicus]|uniref:efflux RND transporter periplasmic adaptor subunit n=1 Tax=Myroides pelagicus TaxID=270914 RepID=UPI002DB96769|nr:efflux RND transporter periplasmic adaptor subunit [Myroides pelagicus]MEC4115098.1 efflux RND transporter periplasmic adaptor subunit [Myroides pelagicus]
MIKYSTKQWKIQKVLSFLILTIILSACGSQSQEKEMPVIETNFVTLNKNQATITNTYPGMIEGVVNVDIKAQVSGYLENIYVQEGDYVQKGQSLFRIKGAVFNEQVNSSNAALKSAQANLATATLEVEKLEPLVEGKVVSLVQLNESKARYDAALAQVAQAKARLSSSKLNAEFALIKAPVSGYIGRIPSRIGNLVTPSDTQPLTQLSDISSVFVYFSLSEADFIAYLKEQKDGEVIELILADGSIYKHQGKLGFASGSIDRKTGSMTMKAVFENPNKLLRSGGSVRVVIKKVQNNVLKVSKLYVKDIQDKFFVFKLEQGNIVKMTPIDIIGSSGDYYLVKKGLNKGDRIASNRIDVLKDSMKVTPIISESSHLD